MGKTWKATEDIFNKKPQSPKLPRTEKQKLKYSSEIILFFFYQNTINLFKFTPLIFLSETSSI